MYQNLFLIWVRFKLIWAEDFLRGVFNDAYVIWVLIFFIKAYNMDTHLNYLDKFIKAYCGYSFELPQFTKAIQMQHAVI